MNMSLTVWKKPTLKYFLLIVSLITRDVDDDSNGGGGTAGQGSQMQAARGPQQLAPATQGSGSGYFGLPAPSWIGQPAQQPVGAFKPPVTSASDR